MAYAILFAIALAVAAFLLAAAFHHDIFSRRE